MGAGAHVPAIKDTAGLLRTPGPRQLVVALRSCFVLFVHVHIHDTLERAAGQLHSLLVRGRRRRCCRAASRDNESVRAELDLAATAHTECDLPYFAVCTLEQYWELVRKV